MLPARMRSHGSDLFTGILLLGLVVLWMRAAVLISVPFFGKVAFPGTDEVPAMLFTT